MEMDEIIRESGKLCSRLFDHKPVVSAEIHQFLNEFETKKAKRRNRNLESTLAIAADLGQTQLPNASLLLGDHIPKLVASLEVSTRMMEKIAEKQGVDAFDEERRSRRKQREAVWNAFMEELCLESNRIEEEYEEEKKKVIDHYGELNKQIRGADDRKDDL